MIRFLRRFQERHRDLDFEGIYLPPEGVALDLHIHQTEQRLISPNFFRQQDRAGAGAPDGLALPKGTDWLQQLVRNHQFPNSGRLAPGNNQTLQTFQLLRQAHFCYISPEFLEADAMFPKIALKG